MATMRAAVVHVMEKLSDKELRETILSSVSKADFPRAIATAVLEASAKAEGE